MRKDSYPRLPYPTSKFNTLPHTRRGEREAYIEPPVTYVHLQDSTLVRDWTPVLSKCAYITTVLQIVQVLGSAQVWFPLNLKVL